MNLATFVGLIIGLLFGLSGVSTLFAFMSDVVSEAQTQIQQIGVASTLILLIIAVVIIVKVKVIASLIAGAVVGAVINLLLNSYGIDFLAVLRSFLGF